MGRKEKQVMLGRKKSKTKAIVLWNQVCEIKEQKAPNVVKMKKNWQSQRVVEYKAGRQVEVGLGIYLIGNEELLKNLGKECARSGLSYRKDSFGPSENGGLQTEKLDLGTGTKPAL